MNIAVIGLSHNTASTEIREKVAFTDMKRIEAVNLLLDQGIDEVVILSTCNRNEIYIGSYEKDLDENIEVVKNFYSRFFGLEDMEKHLYSKKSEKAIVHLYTVTSGLDSIVIGEDQILGQVKSAHLLAMELGASKKVLNKLFREAVSTAKKIKSDLKISEHPLSISYIGVKFLKEKMESFKEKKALIIGMGKMGELALKYLGGEDFERIYITNRNHQKVIHIANDYGEVEVIEYKDRYKILNEVDVLITATASPHTIINKDKIKTRKKELYILDMALPRDVDVKIGKLDKIHLYDVDDLKLISSYNEKRRQELLKEAKKIIKNDVEDYKQWMESIKVDPVIKSLQKKCQLIEEDTLEYIYRKIDLDKRDKKILEKMLSSALKRVIREPILKLKEMKEDEKRDDFIKTLEYLFDIRMG